MRINKRRNGLINARVDLSQFKKSSLPRGGGGGENLVTTGEGGGRGSTEKIRSNYSCNLQFVSFNEDNPYKNRRTNTS